MDFALPQLGEGVYEAELLRWLVQPGDAVKRGQTLMEVLTDKATMEVPAPFAGKITTLQGEPGQTLKIGQLSSPIRTKVGLHVLAVCGKRASGAGQVDHDQIESRLTGQQLSMISRRYMRDLRNSATIETR